MSSQEQVNNVVRQASDLIAAVFCYLKEHYGDIKGAAEEIGCTRSDILRILKNNPKRAQELEDEYLDDLECKVYQSASGGSVPEGFRATEALRILAIKRPDQWDAKRQKGKEKEPTVPTLPSEKSHANKLVNGFVGKHHGEGDHQPKPEVVRVDVTKWNV